MKRHAMLLVMTIMACQDPTAMDLVTVDLDVFPLTVAAGDTVNIIVSAGNPTDETVTLAFGTDCQFLYRITTLQGLPVAPPNPWLCTQGRTTLVLGPLSTGSFQYYWEASVPTGSYLVFGYLGENRVREAGPITIIVQ